MDGDENLPPGGPPPQQPAGPQQVNEQQLANVLANAVAAALAGAEVAREQREMERAAARNALEATRRAEKPPAGLRSPVFTGGADSGGWASFTEQFHTYVLQAQLTEQNAKFALFRAISGRAADLIIGMGSQSNIFRDSNFVEYCAHLGLIFRPSSEQTLARSRFQERRQQVQESVQAFSAAKRSLWMLAYPEARDESVLVESFLQGLSNGDVMRNTLNFGPFNTLAAVTNRAMQSVGVERQMIRDLEFLSI